MELLNMLLCILVIFGLLNGLNQAATNVGGVILVKAFLKIQGTSTQKVTLEGGQAYDQKWMIKFQSTHVSLSSISYAQFKGPKKALQLTNVADGFQQNTGTLARESSTFSANTEIGANCYNPNYMDPLSPSLKLHSCSITQATISSDNLYSEPICITNSNIFYGTFYPRAGNEGVGINHCTVRNMTIDYSQAAGPSQFQMINSNVMNATMIDLNGVSFSGIYAFIVKNSTIRDFSITSSNNYFNQQQFIFEDSSMYNVSTRDRFDYYWYSYSTTPSIIIRNCKYTLDNLVMGVYYSLNSVSIRNSVLTKVNFTVINPYIDNNSAGRPFSMRNVTFTDGTINMSQWQADIAYSTITLVAPPLSVSGNSRISCISIGRAGSISQSNTVGISATGLFLIDSTIKNFAVALQVSLPYLDTVTISKTNFYSNLQYNIENQDPYNVTATGVYWGTSDTGVIVNKINDYWDDINYGEVLYTNYARNPLAAEIGCQTYRDDWDYATEANVITETSTTTSTETTTLEVTIPPTDTFTPYPGWPWYWG